MPIQERGLGLSGGQKQSIGIARAFLLKAPIMLMDEPSNAMDQLTESNLLNNMNKGLKGVTTLYVTQKMNLLNIVDRVIVMNDGYLHIDEPKDIALKKLSGGDKT